MVEFSSVDRLPAGEIQLAALGSAGWAPVGAYCPLVEGGDRYRRLGPAHGVLSLSDPDTPWVVGSLGGAVFDCKPLGGSQDEVTLVVPPFDNKYRRTVRVRLVDADTGQPIARPGFRVVSTPTVRGMLMKQDRNGVGEVVVSPGEYWLQAAVPTHAFHNVRFRVPPDQDVDLGDIRLQLGAGIRGSIVDEMGRVLESEVALIDDRGFELYRGGFLTHYGDDHFALDGAAPGRARIGIRDARFAVNAHEVTVERGTNRGIRLTASPGTRCRFENGAAWGVVVLVHEGDLVHCRVAIAAGGSESIRLYPGAYDLALAGGGWRQRVVVDDTESVFFVEPDL